MVTEPPAFSIASTADFDAPATSKDELRLELADAEDPHAVARLRDHARGDERLDRDRRALVELAGLDRLLDAAEIDLVQVDARSAC